MGVGDMDFEFILYLLTSIFLIIAAIYLVKSSKETGNKEGRVNNPGQYPSQSRDQAPFINFPYEYYMRQEDPRQYYCGEPFYREPRRPRNTVLIEVELPELPYRVKIPFEKLDSLISLIRENSEEVLGRKAAAAAQPNTTSVETDIEKRSWSTIGHPDKPWIDIISKVSGLEFSKDGARVYCPRHGWTHYIVSSDGRILCGEGGETLWDPNTPKTYPVNELKQVARELAKLEKEVKGLRNMAQIQPMEIPENREQGYMEETEEAEEEYGEEEHEG